ncbi:MAG: helix-turn-helix domain-containing protein [Oscillospiraceae bacterium]|jgi:transcriptional regulator with XRE-family HTH domain|nr:helix-turn-helix domain-containing protein [Oscillospiraceae bacterium]
MSTVERIIALMDKQGINGKVLTTELGISSSSVTEWKKGKAKPSVEAIVKIAQYFQVTTDWLLTGEENSKYSAAQSINNGVGAIVNGSNSVKCMSLTLME